MRQHPQPHTAGPALVMQQRGKAKAGDGLQFECEDEQAAAAGAVCAGANDDRACFC